MLHNTPAIYHHITDAVIELYLKTTRVFSLATFKNKLIAYDNLLSKTPHFAFLHHQPDGDISSPVIISYNILLTFT